MDKVLFEGKGVCSNKSEYYELVKMNSRHKERRLRPILLTCAVLSLIFCLYDIIIDESIMALISAGFAFLMFYSTTFSYLPEAMKLYETDKNTVLNVTLSYVFYDNRFSVTKKGKESFLSYSKINDVRQSRTKVYFFTDDKTYFVDKNKLGDAGAEDLIKLLRSEKKK